MIGSAYKARIAVSHSYVAMVASGVVGRSADWSRYRMGPKTQPWGILDSIRYNPQNVHRKEEFSGHSFERFFNSVHSKLSSRYFSTWESIKYS